MNTLDSPLEALALNYLSYGFLTAVNSICAWIAVITAAVSFWRIRASSQPEGPKPTAKTTAPAAEPARASTPVVERKHLSTPITTTSYCVMEREISTKTKFSLYYNEDDDDLDCRITRYENVPRRCNETGTVISTNDDWEKMMVVRMGDMGWYRWQDTTALDGSVVRLWDGCRRRRAAALVVDGGVRCNNNNMVWLDE